jgi:hypothetical protein
MAFRRATGRDEMLKRNMEKLAARRRASASKPTATKQDLKVNAKPTVNYMGSVGAYGKDAPEYGKMLEGVKPPSQVKPPTAPPPVPPDPPAETPPVQPETPPAQPQTPSGKLADLRGGGSTEDKSYRSAGAGAQPKPRSGSNNQSKSDTINTEAAEGLKKQLKSFLSSVQNQLAKAPASSQGIRIGTKNKAGKFWAGSKYGFQSEASYKKLKAAGKI